MGIILKTGKKWERAIDILYRATSEIEEVLDEDIEQDHAVKLLRQVGLEEQAEEIVGMSPSEWDDFATNHLY
jgi:hypothetical protein